MQQKNITDKEKFANKTITKIALTFSVKRINLVFVSSTPVNQQAIAERLNVSIATVSKALRNQPEISEATRARVLEAAQALGYRRDRGRTARRDIRPSQSVMVAALLHRPLDHGTQRMPEYLDGLCEAAGELNATLVVQKYRYQEPIDRLIFDQRIQPPAMREGKVQGLVLGGAWPHEVVSELSRSYPCVCFPHNVSDPEVDVIGLDNVNTTMKVVRHLAHLGHTRIGFFGRCPAQAWASERFAGYVNATSRLGLPYHPDWVVDVDEDPLLNEGYEDVWRVHIDRIDELVKAGVRAWMCSSDWPGYQLYRGMLDRGRRVPEDVSITGFDDSEPVNLGCPPLTSVRIPRDVIGHAAMRRLLFRIQNPDSPVRQTLFQGRLVIHNTTAPLAERAH